ncbi:MAG: response regulator [Desulfobacterales bacterium]|nr:response regulator [Desulfobacterales bacterium]
MRDFHILLVDDDPYVIKATAKLLNKRGYYVTSASSGEEALSLLDETGFDLVITDLIMFKIGGLDVLKKAKQKDSETMVIIQTGFGDMGSAIEALRNNADDYILKPCEGDEICFRVERCLDHLRLKRKIKCYEKMIPVCSGCKRIRDDTGKEPGNGEWVDSDTFLFRRAKVDITSIYCPICLEKQREQL